MRKIILIIGLLIAPWVVLAQTKVGLMLPLSGPHAALGQELSQAALLAVHTTAPHITLVVVDSQNNIAESMQILRKHGVRLIIGPVFANEVAALKPHLRSETILSLSSDKRVKEENCFVTGITPLEQVLPLLMLAKERDLKTVGVFVHQGAAGDAWKQAFEESARNLGLNAVTYQVAKDFKDYRDLVKKFHQNGVKALLIPEGGIAVQSFIANTFYHGLDGQHMRLMGSVAWQDGETLQDPLLQGAWVVLPNVTTTRHVRNDYEQAFHKHPTLLTYLMYDLVVIAGTVGKELRDNPHATLTHETGFAGLLGSLRFLPNGESKRTLKVYEVHAAGQVRLVR